MYYYDRYGDGAGNNVEENS